MGVKQWIFQRISNLVFVLFGLWLLVGLMGGGETATLAALLSDGSTKVFLTVVLLLAGLNSVLAGWQIAGDPTPLRGEARTSRLPAAHSEPAVSRTQASEGSATMNELW